MSKIKQEMAKIYKNWKLFEIRCLAKRLVRLKVFQPYIETNLWHEIMTSGALGSDIPALAAMSRKKNVDSVGELEIAVEVSEYLRSLKVPSILARYEYQDNIIKNRFFLLYLVGEELLVFDPNVEFSSALHNMGLPLSYIFSAEALDQKVYFYHKLWYMGESFSKYGLLTHAAEPSNRLIRKLVEELQSKTYYYCET